MTVLLLTQFGCKKGDVTSGSNDNLDAHSRFDNKGEGYGNVSPALVLLWNDAATYVITRTLQLQPTPRIPPFRESHYYAMVNIAMHDALNNIVPKYKTYALNAREKKASPDAAVAQAAYEVITYFYGRLNPPTNVTPQAVKDSIQNLLVRVLNEIPNGEEKTNGIALGTASAQAIIQNRLNDGSATAVFPIQQGTLSGEYRSTPPFEASGFYDSPGWGDVKPFSIQSSSQFPVPAPYPLNSPGYTADYNEIKAVGCNTCTGPGGRTADQEKIARFWVESSALGWNNVTKAIVAQRNMDAWKVARVLALVQISIADAYISCLKYKMNYFFWRPNHAIRLGDADGNPNTTGDPTWQVLVSPVPPIADHPSAHATAGGAAAKLLKEYFGYDNIPFTFESSSLPAQPRSYTSFLQAARENSLSRIYVGYHFRKACTDGEALGIDIGFWVATHTLQEN